MKERTIIQIFDNEEFDSIFRDLIGEEAKKIRQEFFDKYAVYKVENEGYIAVLRGFEEFLENGEEVTDVDELDTIMVSPPHPIVLGEYGTENF